MKKADINLNNVANTNMIIAMLTFLEIEDLTISNPQHPDLFMILDKFKKLKKLEITTECNFLNKIKFTHATNLEELILSIHESSLPKKNIIKCFNLKKISFRKENGSLSTITEDDYPFLHEVFTEKCEDEIFLGKYNISLIKIDENLKKELNKIGFENINLAINAFKSLNKSFKDKNRENISIENLLELFKKIGYADNNYYPLPMKYDALIMKHDDETFYALGEAEEGFKIINIKNNNLLSFLKTLEFNENAAILKHDDKTRQILKKHLDLSKRMMHQSPGIFIDTLIKYKTKKELLNLPGNNMPKELIDIILSYLNPNEYDVLINKAIKNPVTKKSKISQDKNKNQNKNNKQQTLKPKKQPYNYWNIVDNISGFYLGNFIKWQIKSFINNKSFNLKNKFSIFAGASIFNIGFQLYKKKSIENHTMYSFAAGIIPFEKILPEKIVRKIEPEFVRKKVAPI